MKKEYPLPKLGCSTGVSTVIPTGQAGRLSYPLPLIFKGGQKEKLPSETKNELIF